MFLHSPVNGSVVVGMTLVVEVVGGVVTVEGIVGVGGVVGGAITMNYHFVITNFLQLDNHKAY